MIKKEPRMEYSDLLAFLLIYLGLLIFIITLHLITINTNGFTSNVMNRIFIISLSIYIGGVIFGVVYEIIHLLRWLVWTVSTPIWEKDNQKKE